MQNEVETLCFASEEKQFVCLTDIYVAGVMGWVARGEIFNIVCLDFHFNIPVSSP